MGITQLCAQRTGKQRGGGDGGIKDPWGDVGAGSPEGEGAQGARDPIPGMGEGRGEQGAAQPDTGSRSRERGEVLKGSIAILISYESILTCHGQRGRLTPELQDLINGLSKPYL